MLHILKCGHLRAMRPPAFDHFGKSITPRQTTQLVQLPHHLLKSPADMRSWPEHLWVGGYCTCTSSRGHLGYGNFQLTFNLLPRSDVPLTSTSSLLLSTSHVRPGTGH